ncbi:hypothetical protein SSABA_v1c06430 [Spiroplasma sabaudiense Ar-1343]|uniref:Serine aminopeptidase S33 domain-containing protein n=1 Tax=Spiroplasma sabaudiense Ar-1343 TaxID=1276257 RepID=W6AB07_9MOLU|nr:alpha/beta hydrolase [Spiroplasma sabaudiense]AHI54045.1 hypothetical protein SSABA_v1c06430 [Spiroplasma sabaudiense Ar-1343]
MTGSWVVMLLYAIIGFFEMLILAAIIFKIIIFNTLSKSSNKIQAPELVKKKFFITSDQYNLKWFGEINPNGQEILLCLHDLGYSSKQFDKLEDFFLKKSKTISVISYDQRNYGRNNATQIRNLGQHLQDLKSIVSLIKSKHPEQNISILASGFGALLAQEFFNNTDVGQIFLFSIPSKIFQTIEGKTFFKVFGGTLFSSKKLVKLNYSVNDFTTDTIEAKAFDQNLTQAGFISVREIYQFKILRNRFWKKISKNNKKVVIWQSDNDVLSDSKFLSKKVQISKLPIQQFKIVKAKKHLLLNDINSEVIFNEIKEVLINEGLFTSKERISSI